MASLSNIDKTTSSDRPEVVVTDESSGDYANVIIRTGDSVKAIATSAQLIGHDGVHAADVKLEGGIRKLQTNATATVESLLGQAVFPFTAIKILNIGSNGDTVRIQIPDDSVDVTYTKTASETDINDVAKAITSLLDLDSNFDALYEADTPTGSNQVCIQAKEIFTLREDAGDVIVTNTGTINAELQWDTIEDRPLALAIFPSSDDCTKGTINVQGEIGIIESGRPPKRILLKTSGGSFDMGVDGSITPVEFKLSNDSDFAVGILDEDFIVTELRIEATVNTLSNTFDKYIGVPALSVGHRVQVRSQGNLEYDELLQRVPDVFHAFVFGAGSKFDDKTGSGDDSLVAVFARPFLLRKTGSFPINDDIIVTVQDDMSAAAIKRLQMSVVGFFDS